MSWSRQLDAVPMSEMDDHGDTLRDPIGASAPAPGAAYLIVGGFAACVFLIFAFVPWAQNADDLMPTIVSLQKLTVYFWGQNRFANLLPMLTTWIRSPEQNAEAQLLLRVVFGLMAPAFFCGLFFQRWVDVWRATLAADCLVLIAASPAFLHETYIVATPYGTALACAALAMALLDRKNADLTGWRLALAEVAGAALLLAAYLVNFSLWMTSIPLLGMLAVLAPSPGRRRFLMLNILMALFGLLAPMVLAPAYFTRLSTVPPLSGFAPFAAQVWASTGWVFLGCAVVPVLAGLGLTQGRERWRLARFAGVTLAACVALFSAAASSTHVALNDYHMRYFVPALIALMAVGGAGGWQALRARHQGARVLALTVALMLGSVRLLALDGSTADIIKPDEAGSARVVAARVTSLRLDGIEGNYWHVWPAVFAAEQMRHDLGATGSDIMGITQRGEARRDTFLARLSAKGRLRLACIDFPVERCLEEVNIVMNPPALHVREFAPEEQIPGGRTLRFVEIDLAD